MLHLDSSVLVEAFGGPGPVADALEQHVADRRVLAVSTLALYEFWRGPRTQAQERAFERLLACLDVVLFGPAEAQEAARLFRQVRRARQRQIDLAIAACVIVHGSALWTLNRGDFEDIPGLVLIDTR